jgi:thiol-disulfide isomerase/thioredoxin
MTARTGAAMTGAMTGAMTSNRGGQPRIEGEAPSFDGAVAWLNSPAVSSSSLRGKVVLIDFWTYSCINCLRALPYVRGWNELYRDKGLVVIGIHSPEFAFEKNENNVKRAVKDLGITYPVALDNDYVIWRAFNNQYWPAHYFIDAKGQIRGHHFGEGNYEESEQSLRDLLTEAGSKDLPAPLTKLKNDGVQAPADERNVASPETYVGYDRAKDFASPGGLDRDQAKSYAAPPQLQLNQWALAGAWQVAAEKAVSTMAGARIVFRFHARDLHLVAGPESSGKPVRFRVTVDGKAPGPDHGVDVDASGVGSVREQRLYQLVRQDGDVRDRTFEIEFLDAGVAAYSFTFG